MQKKMYLPSLPFPSSDSGFNWLGRKGVNKKKIYYYLYVCVCIFVQTNVTAIFLRHATTI